MTAQVDSQLKDLTVKQIPQDVRDYLTSKTFIGTSHFLVWDYWNDKTECIAQGVHTFILPNVSICAFDCLRYRNGSLWTLTKAPHHLSHSPNINNEQKSKKEINYRFGFDCESYSLPALEVRNLCIIIWNESCACQAPYWTNNPLKQKNAIEVEPFYKNQV